MTTHPYDITTLRRELHLERIAKYIKKTIAIINKNPADKTNIQHAINLLRTKERLYNKMNNHIELYMDYGCHEDKLLALLINNILDTYSELNSKIVNIILEKTFFKHLMHELKDDSYGSSYDGGYDSY
jgi:hypothetical protein